ncbi:MAG: hypothetical protein JJD98_18855, partial [Polaromonas sp.]|nr:hypothetical protein [Polaromonas sp.]
APSLARTGASFSLLPGSMRMASLNAARDKSLWLGLGFSYLHTGNSDLSLAAFNEAIRIDPGNKEKLAPVLAKLGAP